MIYVAIMDDNIREYWEAHIEKILDRTMDMYKLPGAVCKKCCELESINCIFCYCPLYDTDCKGNFKFIESKGKTIKDCSDCTRPHTREFAKQLLRGIYIRDGENV